jgi:hypothetical protein
MHHQLSSCGESWFKTNYKKYSTGRIFRFVLKTSRSSTDFNMGIDLLGLLTTSIQIISPHVAPPPPLKTSAESKKNKQWLYNSRTKPWLLQISVQARRDNLVEGSPSRIELKDTFQKPVDFINRLMPLGRLGAYCQGVSIWGVSIWGPWCLEEKRLHI